ncbi:pyridoxamine 5'-phosphate oxidase family protein [Paenibacillus luteus]|uniref:pyridoxamine 5'-phosphate oxidase family protein n=1 Tax=Paenibacillus luteus TaxID=2545753 RepID=UPI001144183B|nr:pyridoxamine 5'-phosphate oxidase family protein [Paenibacillus luteus]
MSPIFKDSIQSEEQLRELLGYPSPLVMKKTINYLDEHCKSFIERSPMLFISTADRLGSCDVSPRGDQSGFVHILGDKHLVIPERPGNRRLDSILNILENPNIGILFVIPQLEETLRINGIATVIKDKAILERMKAFDKEPLVAIGVEVEECYIHCAKAFKRSRLWQPDSWLSSEHLPNAAKILAAHTASHEDDIAASLKETYEKRLY